MFYEDGKYIEYDDWGHEFTVDPIGPDLDIDSYLARPSFQFAVNARRSRLGKLVPFKTWGK